MRIINISEVRRAAFEYGFGRFKNMDPVDPETFDLEHFTESAEYANVVAPTLRQFAGYSDGGHGTYTVDRTVIAVHADDADELAAEAGWIDAADRRASDLFHDVIHEAWREGVYEAVDVLAAAE